MKTRKSIFSVKNASAAVTLFILCMTSCQKDSSILTATDTQSVDAESASSGYFSEGSDISTNAVSGISTTQYAGAKTSSQPLLGLAVWDDRLKCAAVTIDRTGTRDTPSGSITITFDPSCTDKRGIKRSGTIVIHYAGRRWMANSYISVHADFYRNDVHVVGTDSLVTQTSADSTHLQFKSTLDGEVTFGNGKTITRTHNLTREWVRASLPINDEWHTLVGGTAGGKFKNNATYQMQITQTLVHKTACLAEQVVIPVSGEKQLMVTDTNNNERKYVIDYGDGTCDNSITVTIDNKEKTIVVNGDGD